MPDPAPSARGLDTNVLARYLLADDLGQHEAARALIEDELTPEAPGLVDPVALCELVWVLRQVYKVPKDDIVRALRLVLSVRTLRVLDRAAVRAATDLFEAHGADFADCLLHVRYREAGSALATFDRAASGLPDARRLRSG
ncbi:MAG: type II toxin-antitoxin system VapC family toxin [Bacteroidota bacterium]